MHDKKSIWWTQYTFLNDLFFINDKPMKRNSGVKKGVKYLVVGVVYSYKVIEVTLMYGSQQKLNLSKLSLNYRKTKPTYFGIWLILKST